jgi:superoxide reductase
MLAVGNIDCPLPNATCQVPTSQKTNHIFNKYNNIMPRVFKATEIEREEKEIKRDYLDRHMPHVICPDEVKRGERFAVKVKLGEEYPHPDEHDHFISVIQLWNRETLLAEARYTAGVYGNKPTHYEIDFYIVAPEVSMNLSAMSVCTKHGLWQSEDKAVKVI